MDSDQDKSQPDVAQVCQIDDLFSLSSLVSELCNTSEYMMEGSTSNQDIIDERNTGNPNMSAQKDTGNPNIPEQKDTGNPNIPEQKDTGNPNIPEQKDTGNPNISEQRDTIDFDTLEQRTDWRTNIVGQENTCIVNYTGKPSSIKQKNTGSPSSNVKVISEESYKVENKMYFKYLIDIDQDSAREQTDENSLENTWSQKIFFDSLADEEKDAQKQNMSPDLIEDTESPNKSCDQEQIDDTGNPNRSEQLEDTGDLNKDTGNPNNIFSSKSFRKDEAYPEIDKCWLPDYLKPKPKYFKYIIDIKDPDQTQDCSKKCRKTISDKIQCKAKFENQEPMIRCRDSDNLHKCQHCERTFVHQHALRIHIQTHKTNTETIKACQSKKKPQFQCRLCPKEYTCKYDLKRHYISHCTEKPFKCEVCGKDFEVRGALNVHLRTHTGSKPYKCVTCNKAFAQKNHLIEHGKVHTKIQNQHCTMCKKSFRYRSCLDRHMQKKHKIAQKKYPCSMCPKSKGQNVYVAKQSLTSHFRTHSVEKLYQCFLCESSFATKSSLNVHRRIHTGDRLDCPICFKSFAVSYVKIHLKTSHNKII